jgi:Na+-driven multidrug efflux pump
MMPLVAYNYAAKNYPRMRDFAHRAQIYGMTTAAFFIVVFQVFPREIVTLFIRDAETVKYGTEFLRIACLATPFMIANFQKVFCLQAMGKGKESLLLGVCRQGLFAIPILLILNHYVGLYGVVAAQAISDTCTFVLATFIYRRVYNKLVTG